MCSGVASSIHASRQCAHGITNLGVCKRCRVHVFICGSMCNSGAPALIGDLRVRGLLYNKLVTWGYYLEGSMDGQIVFRTEMGVVHEPTGTWAFPGSYFLPSMPPLPLGPRCMEHKVVENGIRTQLDRADREVALRNTPASVPRPMPGFTTKLKSRPGSVHVRPHGSMFL